MKRNTILTKILAISLLTIILSAALTALVFNYYGKLVFSNIKADEIEPRAKYIAEVTSDYLQNFISRNEYERAIGSGYFIWDAEVYVFNADKELFVYPARPNRERNADALTSYLDGVLSGESLFSPNTKNSLGVIVGEPVESAYGNIIGAVFMIKPLDEVRTAMNSLLVALLISMVAISLIMIVPVYLWSRNLARPIQEMNRIAKAMADGDFNARAPSVGTVEILELGNSLNYLSAALSATIDDLTFEKNRLSAVINGLGEGIIAVRASGDITTCNPAAYRFMEGRDGESICESPLYGQLKAEIEAVLSGGKTAVKELSLRDRILRVTITALYAEDEVEGAVMLIQDVTEAARLEQTRTDYVANVSHELRTPIASIRSLADALNDGLIKKEEDRCRYYGYILHESIRLSRLIDDLLELSRLQSGAVALTKQKMSVGELICDVADRYAVNAQEKGMAIQVDVPDDCPKVYTNPDRAEQVLIALIDNAIKHADADRSGVIRVQAVDRPDHVEILVQNPGEIDSVDLEHLFDRFYKVDQSHSGKGTGLGLSIAKEIMRLMEEEITVSCRDGVVTFLFTLGKSANKDKM